MCDYEIETDLLASQIGEAIHAIRHIHKEDLLLLCEQVYHANGSIGACKMHVLRSQTKKVIRHMHRIQKERNAPGSYGITSIVYPIYSS